MKNLNSLFITVLTITLFSCSADKKGNEATSTEEAQTEESILLLQDNSLDQWEMYNGGEINGWEVIDGELHASGAGWDANQDIITKKEYADFDLSLEWKIEAANSSGIFYFVQKGTNKAIYESAPEYQVLDDLGWPEQMKPNQYTSANYAMHAPEGVKIKPAGEWNTSEIIVKYPHVEHWLNGVKVLEYDFGTEDWLARKAAGKWAEVPNYGIAKSGHIGLQNAGEVVYRNIKIKEL